MQWTHVENTCGNESLVNSLYETQVYFNVVEKAGRLKEWLMNPLANAIANDLQIGVEKMK